MRRATAAQIAYIRSLLEARAYLTSDGRWRGRSAFYVPHIGVPNKPDAKPPAFDAWAERLTPAQASDVINALKGV